MNQRVNEGGKESGQHFGLFRSAFHKVCFRNKDILFEDRIKGFYFNFCFKKFKICLIISILLFLVDFPEKTEYIKTLPFIPHEISPVLLIDRVRGGKCSLLVFAVPLVGRFKKGFISAKAP